MRASSRRTSRNRTIGRVALGGVILLILLVLVPRTVSYVSAIVMTPFISLERWLSESTASLPAYVRERGTLLATQEALEQELAAQSGSRQTIERLQAENTSLRALLGATTSDRIAAGVIAQPNTVPYDVLVIDKGSDDGVVQNAPVFAGYDQVLGFVAEVFSGSAVVTLATTPGFESTVYIVGPDIYTTAVGQGGGVLQVGVPQGILMSVGDQVVLPSLEAGVYGEIVSIDALDSRPEQYGYVTADEPLSSIRWVSIGTESLKPLSFEAARTIVDTVKADLIQVPVPEGVLVEIPADAATTTATSSVEVINPET